MPELTPPTPPTDGTYEDNFIEEPTSAPPAAPVAPPTPPTDEASPAAPRASVPPAPPPPPVATVTDDDGMADRLERLGGEMAPLITPEDFARLQNAGQVHIDAQGRVRTARRSAQADAGVTLRKRRAWYADVARA
ncbi:MAG: hypothetical protein MUC99_01000 [Anaerolineae bacterium]|jgi:hypothetical protein|nr:hypothetical protein [Anaerolineae bacterium]